MQPPTEPLAGLEIAITGRLASMTRDEAVRAIAAGGGRFVEQPGEHTDLLVVGAEGWPLLGDGRLTQALRRARELELRGVPIRIADEIAFLEQAGLAASHQDLGRPYTTAQLARVLDVPAARLRRLVERGLVRPQRVVRRLHYLDFAEVARARALIALLEAGATVQAVRRSLARLRHWLPEANRAIQQLELLDLGPGNVPGELPGDLPRDLPRDLVVRLDDGRIVEPDGQLRFAFAGGGAGGPDSASPPASIHAVDGPTQPPRRQGPEAAQRWFASGVAAEDAGDLDGALDAYHHAQLAHGPQPEICFNLGNVLHGLGRIAEAAQRYRMAVELDPEYVEAWNNLGNALGELGRFEDALRAYDGALALEPHYADAHFNLAETHQQLERYATAAQHWRAYLAEAPHAGDRAYVERMLADCERRARG